MKQNPNFEDCSENPPYTGRNYEETNLDKKFDYSCVELQKPSNETEKEEKKNNDFVENSENKNTGEETDENNSEKEKTILNFQKNENIPDFNIISNQNPPQLSNCKLNNLHLINETPTSVEKKNDIELEKSKPKFIIENKNKTASILAFMIFSFKDNIKTKQIGRIPDYLKFFGVKGKHNKNTIDNYTQKIFEQCKDSLNKSIKKIFFQKYKFYPHDLNINSQIKGGYKGYRNFCRKKLIDIYCDSFPKNQRKNEKVEKSTNNHNKSRIIQAINLEKKDKNSEKKVLYKLFYKTIFYSVLEAFLDDKQFIEIEGTIINFGLEEFVTYSFCMNYISKEKKEAIKGNLIRQLKNS